MLDCIISKCLTILGNNFCPSVIKNAPDIDKVLQEGQIKQRSTDWLDNLGIYFLIPYLLGDLQKKLVMIL